METSTSRVDSINIWNELAFASKDSLSLALSFAHLAKQFSEEINYQEGIADALMRIGAAYQLSSADFESTEAAYLEAATIREDFAFIAAAKSYNALGLLCKKHGQYDTGKIYYQKACNIIVNNKERQALKVRIRSLMGLSFIFRRETNYLTALQLLNQSMELARELKDPLEIGKIYFQMGLVYQDLDTDSLILKNYNLALENFAKKNYKKEMYGRTLLSLGQYYFYKKDYVKAESYYQDAFSSKRYLSKNDLANLQESIGSLFEKTGKHQEALKAYEDCLKTYVILGRKSEIGLTNLNIGTLLLNSGGEKNVEQAIVYLEQSRKIFEEINDPSLKVKVITQLSRAYQFLKADQKDYLLIREYPELMNTLFKNYQDALSYQLDLEDLQHKNEMLESEFALERSESNRKNWIIGSMVAIAILTILYFLNDKRRRVAEYRQIETEQQVDKLLRNRDIEQLEAKDKERRKIGRDLHDKLSNTLGLVTIRVDAIEEKLDRLTNSNGEAPYPKASPIVAEAVEEIRNFSHGMNTLLLDQFGLLSQVRELANKINESGTLHVEITSFKLDRLPLEKERQIYLIIKELTSNVMKHAKATKLSIQLNHFSNELVNIIVEDNGVGFELSNGDESKGGLGLRSIQTRVNALNGEVSIDSVKGQGTTVIIDIPQEAGASLKVEDIEEAL